MKQKIFIAGSALISLVVNLFGGWDTALETLILFMGIDWFTGGVLLPVVFKKSPKSKSGTLESRAGWKGLCRKGMMLLFVLIVVSRECRTDGSTDTGGDLQDDRSVGGERERF